MRSLVIIEKSYFIFGLDAVFFSSSSSSSSLVATVI